VPEAYLLLKHYETTRPGLLVLDADGRRVDSIALPGMGAPRISSDEIARRLDAAKSAPAIEIWKFEAKGSDASLDSLRETLSKHKGARGASRTGTAFRVKVTSGALQPKTLAKYAAALETSLTIHEPVPVQFANHENGEAAAKAIASLAGTWHADHAPTVHAYVAGLLLRPAALSKAGGRCDVESRHFDLPDIPTGGTACRVAMAPLSLPGVLAIHVDIFNERQTIVGRKDRVDWNDVVAAFAKAGCRARPR
jgi:hypothetical protein